MNDFEKLAHLIFPDIYETPSFYEEKYPPRSLKEGARVTRFPPSPTGYMHMGNLFAAFVDKLTADISNGLFYLRIEDTDKKREVDDGVSKILDGLDTFGIMPNEGMLSENQEKGNYGPYKQSLRKIIYHCFAKDCIARGLAYPCFCTEEMLQQLREKQEAENANPGYYGEYATCRNLSYKEQEEKLKAGFPFTLRLRSNGNQDKKIIIDDLIKGKIEMPENIMDIVLLKTDGLPTYHFAHAVDDHLMRTTHVIRGDEWISSLPSHIQLFQTLGFKPPKYAHISPIMKLDDGNKRKLSKRKDPEAAVNYYKELGYPKESVLEYLLTLANSNYEDWRKANPKADMSSFPFNIKKMSPSGALFDLVKLNDISKNVISQMTAIDIYDRTIIWAKGFDETIYSLFTKNPEYAKKILNIDRETPKPRKDIACWSQISNYVEYFYDDLFNPIYNYPENLKAEDVKAIVNAYLAVYNEKDNKDDWFNTMKDICADFGFTPNVKEYKKSPEKYKGHVGDVSTIIRLAVTGRTNTPDLYSIMQLLGNERVLKRLKSFGGKF